jgi:serine/threonine protein kinase
MHEAKTCYGDIKLSNVLISDGRVMLSGFGKSHFNHEYEQIEVTASNDTSDLGRLSLSERNTDWKGSRLGRPYDIWSLGCVYLEVILWLYGIDSTGNDCSRSALEQHSERLWILRRIDPHIVPPDQSAMIARMIADPPDKRPTAKDLVKCFPCDHSGKPSGKQLSVGSQNQQQRPPTTTGCDHELKLQEPTTINEKILQWIRTTHNHSSDQGS